MGARPGDLERWGEASDGKKRPGKRGKKHKDDLLTGDVLHSPKQTPDWLTELRCVASGRQACVCGAVARSGGGGAKQRGERTKLAEYK